MSVIESVAAGLFCLFIVFLVLAVLYAMVILLSIALRAVTGKNAEKCKTEIEAEPEQAEGGEEQQTARGNLELVNVDDKTAAVVMAIVSYESGIPLDELNFKYIKALGN